MFQLHNLRGMGDTVVDVQINEYVQKTSKKIFYTCLHYPS